MNRTYQVFAASRDGKRTEKLRSGLTRDEAHKLSMELAKRYRLRGMQVYVYNPGH